jgi:hypothetical protein
VACEQLTTNSLIMVARDIALQRRTDCCESSAAIRRKVRRGIRQLFLMPQQLWNPFLHASDPLIVPLLYVRLFIDPFPCL